MMEAIRATANSIFEAAKSNNHACCLTHPHPLACELQKDLRLINSLIEAADQLIQKLKEKYESGHYSRPGNEWNAEVTIN